MPAASTLSRRWLPVSVGMALIVLATAGSNTAASEPESWTVTGGGHTIIEGGTGGGTPQPVITLVAFHATEQDGSFECLALAPNRSRGPGSGAFNTNVMYVTGEVNSLSVRNGAAVLRGVAVVTGIGAGPAEPFKLVVRPGGPGTTIQLTVSGLVFNEILTDGQVDLREES
jgi:hypothetical protein